MLLCSSLLEQCLALHSCSVSGMSEENAQQSLLALFYLCSSLRLDGEGLYFQLFAGCSAETSYLLEVLAPNFQLLHTGISLPPPHPDDLLILCMAGVFLLFDGALLRMPPSSSLFPYVQPYQLGFRQSQPPFTSSAETSTLHPGRTLNPVALARVPLWHFPFLCHV